MTPPKEPKKCVQCEEHGGCDHFCQHMTHKPTEEDMQGVNPVIRGTAMTQRVRHKVVHKGRRWIKNCFSQDQSNLCNGLYQGNFNPDWRYVTCKKCLAKRTMRHSKLGGKRAIH